ncbi:LOW QUALITY PROTEIN: probable plastid-lipid-associated protein 13, chloroplastic [Salvia miltiorrhiza]|uniref:LOW QUALITY PROTEIN: probable plastid-lipid-associated protein 13, chloroplastic n=1 Tax=Salvia miltiorrhiza TaxID=226208 RepID=UPI0025AC1017|nr:LOW QUALITY PROTEIN: probable plastid-lipid-associated protein 13, chloroplastic [Salvia miltiorrhiza]
MACMYEITGIRSLYYLVKTLKRLFLELTSPFLRLHLRSHIGITSSIRYHLSDPAFDYRRFPSELANLSKLDVVIKDLYAKNAASLKFLNSIESKLINLSKLTVEGPLRMKQEFLEGLLESPKVNEESIPQQLRGAFAQATSTAQQLPVFIRDAVSGGFKIPLGGSFERFFMISYLDDEILIIRDAGGVPEVLTRLDPGPSHWPRPND